MVYKSLKSKKSEWFSDRAESFGASWINHLNILVPYPSRKQAPNSLGLLMTWTLCQSFHLQDIPIHHKKNPRNMDSSPLWIFLSIFNLFLLITSQFVWLGQAPLLIQHPNIQYFKMYCQLYNTTVSRLIVTRFIFKLNKVKNLVPQLYYHIGQRRCTTLQTPQNVLLDRSPLKQTFNCLFHRYLELRTSKNETHFPSKPPLLPFSYSHFQSSSAVIHFSSRHHFLFKLCNSLLTDLPSSSFFSIHPNTYKGIFLKCRYAPITI